MHVSFVVVLKAFLLLYLLVPAALAACTLLELSLSTTLS